MSLLSERVSCTLVPAMSELLSRVLHQDRKDFAKAAKLPGLFALFAKSLLLLRLT